MTLTMAYEMAVSPNDTRRTFRPFTAEEDDTIRRMAAEGHTKREIATALGRQYHSIRHRARLLNVAGIRADFSGRASQFDQTLTHCKRCAILLSAAPVGHGGLCGWCTDEQ